mgnify:CR=1 FL=1
MKLDADVVRVVLEFKDFTPLTRFIFPDKHQTRFLNATDQIWIDFIAVAVAFVCLLYTSPSPRDP